jgi:hypothetical protein
MPEELLADDQITWWQARVTGRMLWVPERTHLSAHDDRNCNAWGSRHAIAGLQRRPVPPLAPEAELWMGAQTGNPITERDRVRSYATPDAPLVLTRAAAPRTRSSEPVITTRRRRDRSRADCTAGPSVTLIPVQP